MDNPAAPPNGHDLCMVQAMADLQMASSALTFLREAIPAEGMTRTDRRRLRCFEDAAVISYWRPFTGSDGLRRLEVRNFGVDVTPEQLALHERIRERRNRVIAHTDFERMRLAFATYKVDDDTDVMMPFMDFDDGLAFFDDLEPLREWIKVLFRGAARKTFNRVQGHGEIHVVRDHTLTDRTEPDS